MKKWKVSLSIIHIVAICFMCVGISVILVGVKNIIGIQQNKDISEVKLSDLKVGQYVSGEVTYLCGRLSTSDGDFGKFYPFCNNDILIDDNTYICPIGANNVEYIPITLSREFTQLVEIFSRFSNNQEENKISKIKGKIINQKYSYEEYNLELLGVSGEIIEPKQISYIYEIKLVDFKKESEKWIQGVGILFVGILLLFGFGKPVHRASE